MCVENQFSVWLHIKKHRYFAQRDVGGGRGTETNKLTFSVCVFYPLFHVWHDSFISVAWLIQTSRHDSMITRPLVSVGLGPYLYIVVRPQRQSQRIVDDRSRTPRPRRCCTTFRTGWTRIWTFSKLPFVSGFPLTWNNQKFFFSLIYCSFTQNRPKLRSNLFCKFLQLWVKQTFVRSNVCFTWNPNLVDFVMQSS